MAVLDGLIASVRRGKSRSLVLRGEAGIGKTALLEYAVDSAADLTILRAAGVESEMELAYASLHQLCAPVLDRLERLHPPQRRALEIVFGVSGGSPPDRFLAGLGVLSLLSEAAEARPLLCVIDDAQWIDRASGLTLAFVARRLLADPVGIVFVARNPGEELRHLPELEVRGLHNGDARALLGSVVRFRLDVQVRDRIVADARGNPLALLELPRGLTPTQLAGGYGLTGTHALSARIEDSFVRQLNALPEEERRLLVVAAAEPVGDPVRLWRAAEMLDIAPGSASAAQAAGLVVLGERVAFRHPLVRSASYGSATVEDRRAVHLALAEATDRDADPDRRAWHLAAAAEGPDEEVALELERSAGRAQARGGVAAAAAFLQRAVALTDDAARRGDRALAAAQASFHAGAFDTAFGLLAAAEAGTLDEFQAARVDHLRAHVGFAAELGSDAPRLLLKAARRLEPFDLELARETYLNAWAAAGLAGHLAEEGILLEICRAVQALPPSPGAPGALDLLVDGLAVLATDEHAAATRTLQRAAKALADIPVEDVLRWGWVAAAASTAVWDFEGMHAIAARHVQLARDAGALAQLPNSLSQLGITLPWMGDFTGTASVMAETDSIAGAIGSPIPSYTLLRLRSLEGSEAEALAAISTAVEQAGARGQGMAAAWAHWAAAVLYNGLARYEEAVSAAQQATADTVHPWPTMWVLPELVEAATHAGDTELAREALERLADTTQPCGTDVPLGIEARCRALLSEGAAADELYREAIDRLGRTRLRPELARAHLLYGEWLRREHRRIDARVELRSAHQQFLAIGMEAFAERARKEVLATGAKARRRTVETRDDLTAQERQVAELARDGLTNAEIGARLFLSPRTVEWHLRKVYGKLGIHFRQELASALTRSSCETVEA
jgi:DNA-binding CsgD family transcriptional regulator